MSEILALETKELTRTFGKHVAVNKVSLHVPQGCIYGLVGRNGAGKTTIMKMVTNLMEKTSGEIIVNGKKDKPTNHQVVGTLIEAPGLIPELSAYENLLAKCELMGVDSPKKHAKELVAAMKLENTGKKAVKKFSLGMRQRVGIAMAFCGYPQLVLLDEPINALDPQGINDVREFLFAMKNKGMTIFISSHLLEELGKVADHFGVISEGKLVKELTADEIKKLTSTSVRVRVENAEHAVKILEDKGNSKVEIKDGWVVIQSNEMKPSQINECLMKSEILVYELIQDHVDTEEFFIRIMGGENYA